MRFAEYALPQPCHVLERLHGFAEIVERGASIQVERPRVNPPNSVGRPETNFARRSAMTHLGNGLYDAEHYEDALSVQEAQFSMKRRFGTSESSMLITQGNLANTYKALGRVEEALSIRRDVYSGRLKFNGEERKETLLAASNYAVSLKNLDRFEEAKSLLRKSIPVARRVLGETDVLTLRMRWLYAMALFEDDAATLDDLHEAVETLESVARVWTRVFGEAHPETQKAQGALEDAREALAARSA